MLILIIRKINKYKYKNTVLGNMAHLYASIVGMAYLAVWSCLPMQSMITAVVGLAGECYGLHRSQFLYIRHSHQQTAENEA